MLPLRLAVGLAGLVPVSAGLAGVLTGTSFLGLPFEIDGDSHVRYLSGLLLGIGIAFWATIPRIETHAPRFRLLAAIVVLGGLARLLGVILRGTPSPPMLFGLAMELVVTPALFLWQARVAAKIDSAR